MAQANKIILCCRVTACSFKSNHNDDMISHTFLKYSKDVNLLLKCCYENCHDRFKKLKHFQNHLEKHHKNNEDLKINAIKCNVSRCDYNLKNINDLYSHYYKHLESNNGELIVCFYKDCNYQATTKARFQTHLYSYHKKDTMNLKKEFLPVIDSEAEVEIQIDNSEYEPIETIESSNEPQSNKYLDLENFYMRLYLKLKDKYLIPKYKCDEIFEDINEIIKLNNNYVIDMINGCRRTYNKDKDLSVIIEDTLRSESVYEKVHKKNKHDSVRKRWLKNSGFYVAPIQVNLSSIDSFQYIPIIDSIKALFKNPQISSLYFNKENEKANQLEIVVKYKSFNDSKNFKNNEIFNKEKNALQLILYMDDFETTNPLGDRRGVEKINASYFRLGNLENCYQSVNHITQAVIISSNF